MVSTGFKYEDKSEKGQVFIVLILIINLFITPVGLIHSIINHINIYQMNKFKNRYGSMYEGVDLRKKMQAAFYLIFCVRRVLYVVIIFSLINFQGI